MRAVRVVHSRARVGVPVALLGPAHAVVRSPPFASSSCAVDVPSSQMSSAHAIASSAHGDPRLAPRPGLLT